MRNTHLFIDSNGVITGSYNKCHLFDVDIPNKVKLTESEFVEAGQGLGQPVDSPVGKVGLAICYDLRLGTSVLIQAEHDEANVIPDFPNILVLWP